MMENEKKQEQIAYWLEVAQYDLDTADAMLQTGRFLYVGFMCHQVIEKTLKACFVKNRQGIPPYSHNLRYLAGECGIYEQFTEDHRTFLEILEPLNIESRYPDYRKRIFESLTREKCDSLLEHTKELYRWLRSQL